MDVEVVFVSVGKIRAEAEAVQQGLLDAFGEADDQTEARAIARAHSAVSELLARLSADGSIPF